MNRHPAVMFEIIALDQEKLKEFYSHVFGWSYETGTGNFAYVHFPAEARPLLGGIGQAIDDVPGFDPGTKFYLLVDDLDAALQRVVDAKGMVYVKPTTVDGYRFAMIRDPEWNPVGLIEPFTK